MNDGRVLPEGIHPGDCLEGLARLPDSCVDMAFADPPFNLRKKYKASDDRMGMEDYLRWCEAWLRELVRVVKPGGAVFVHNIPKWLTFYAAMLNRLAVFKHWIAWDAPGSPLGNSLHPSHYGVLYYAKDGARAKFRETRFPHPRCRECGLLRKDYGGKKDGVHPFGPLVSDVWTDLHRVYHNSRRTDHPCQLPVTLLERLALMSTDEGDLILDPFMGTGTTAIAAKRLGRRHMGFELSPEYAEIARGKVARVAGDSRLGDAWVSFHLGQPVTIRDADWEGIARFFMVPEPRREIDRMKIQLRGGNAAVCECETGYSQPMLMPFGAPDSHREKF